MRFEFNFTGDYHWRTHSRVYWRAQYLENDGVTPSTVMPLYQLAGTLRTIADSPTVVLDLTPFLSWTAGAHLTFDLPSALANTPPGMYEYEFVAIDAGVRISLVIGQVDIRKSVNRP